MTKISLIHCLIFGIFLTSQAYLCSSLEPIVPEPCKNSVQSNSDGSVEVSVHFPKAQITQADEYLCTYQELPFNGDESYIVGFAPNASMTSSHHMLVYGCSSPASQSKMWKCGMGQICGGNGENIIVYAWARNAPPLILPPDIGYRVGGKSGYNYLVVQMHFSRPTPPGEFDCSGFTATVTKQPQLYYAGIYLLGSPSVSIPAHSNFTKSDVTCVNEAQAPLHVFAFRTHAHDLGRVITGYRYRAGKYRMIGKGNPLWPQAFYPRVGGAIDLQQGDVLLARCSYQSDRDTVTDVGAGGGDEMCNFYMMYYTPDPTVANMDLQCWGSTYLTLPFLPQTLNNPAPYPGYAGADSKDAILKGDAVVPQIPDMHHHHHAHEMGSKEQSQISLDNEANNGNYTMEESLVGLSGEEDEDVKNTRKKLMKEALMQQLRNFQEQAHSNDSESPLFNNPDALTDYVLTTPESGAGDNIAPQELPQVMPDWLQKKLESDKSLQQYATAFNFSLPLSSTDKASNKSYSWPNSQGENIDDNVYHQMYNNNDGNSNFEEYQELPQQYGVEYKSSYPGSSESNETNNDRMSADSQNVNSNENIYQQMYNNNEDNSNFGEYQEPPQQYEGENKSPYPESRKSGGNANERVVSDHRDEHFNNEVQQPMNSNDREQSSFEAYIEPPLQYSSDNSIGVTAYTPYTDTDSDGAVESASPPVLKMAPYWPKEDVLEKVGQVGGVAVDYNGYVHIFHRADRKWDFTSFDGQDRFTKPSDPIQSTTMFIFNPVDGNLVYQWGDNTFYMPHGVTIDSTNSVWVTDVAMHQVFKYSLFGGDTPLLAIGEKMVPGSDNQHFCKPADVAVAEDGTFYVADGYCNGRVMKFSSSGVFIKTWGSVGSYGAQLMRPGWFNIAHSITLANKEKDICVADRENGRIQCFDRDGNFRKIIQDQEKMGPNVYAIAYSDKNGGLLYAINGYPTLSINTSGFIIQYSTGKIVGEWNSSPNLNHPHDIAVSQSGFEVYVGQLTDRKVYKYTARFDVESATVKSTVGSDLIDKDTSKSDGENTQSEASPDSISAVSELPKMIIDEKPKVVLQESYMSGGIAVMITIFVSIVVLVFALWLVMVLMRRRRLRNYEDLLTVDEFDANNEDDVAFAGKRRSKIGNFFAISNREKGFERISTTALSDDEFGESEDELFTKQED